VPEVAKTCDHQLTGSVVLSMPRSFDTNKSTNDFVPGTPQGQIACRQNGSQWKHSGELLSAGRLINSLLPGL
jgi:hypothetical protein